MRALYNNRFLESGVTITSASEDANYPLTNLTDRRLSRLYKPTSGASQWIKIAGTDLLADCIAIAAHDIALGATVKIEGNDSDSWGDPAFSEYITPNYLLYDECISLSAWTDHSTGDTPTTQVTHEGRSCFKIDSGSTSQADNEWGGIYQDVGSFSGYTKVVITAKHCDLGTRTPDNDYFGFTLQGESYRMFLAFSTLGLQCWDGTWNTIDADAVLESVFQTFKFIIDWANGTVDSFILSGDEWVPIGVGNTILSIAASGAPYTNGAVEVKAFGYSSNNRISYVDMISVISYDEYPTETEQELGSVWQNNLIYTHFFDPSIYDYWRFSIDASSIFSIGGIYLGDHLILPELDLGGSIEDVDTSIIKISKSGQVYGTTQYRYRTGKYTIPLIDHTQRAEMRELWDAVGRTIPFYLVRWADRPDLEAPYYCVLDQDGIKWKGNGDDPNKFETDIAIREVF